MPLIISVVWVWALCLQSTFSRPFSDFQWWDPVECIALMCSSKNCYRLAVPLLWVGSSPECVWNYTAPIDCMYQIHINISWASSTMTSETVIIALGPWMSQAHVNKILWQAASVAVNWVHRTSLYIPKQTLPSASWGWKWFWICPLPPCARQEVGTVPSPPSGFPCQSPALSNALHKFSPLPNSQE